jgi:cysteinyl-tRNA synthetase
MPDPLKLFNTKTHQKEFFKPKDSEVKLYTCGPTVYDYAHIGNLRTYVFEDLLKRVLFFSGYKVHHVMNLTDVDDKTIKGAIQKKVSLDDYTQVYKKAFFEDLEALHIIPANQYPNATDHISEMIEMIQALLNKKIAYVGSDKSVYFSIEKFPEYGKLSHLNLEDLKSGASNRVSNDEYDKENITDFVLWKSYDPKRDGEIYWESPFGKGRPGWHIECSAMAMKYLGDTLDIHMGGVDNIFPHHENEIAQSECVSHKPFCPMWVHVEHLIVEGKKMSKSLGNFYTLRDLFNKGYKGKQIRYMLLQTHYKTQLNFTFDGLKGAETSLERIQNFIIRLQKVEQEENHFPNLKELIKSSEIKFKEALLDDINISICLSVIFDLIRILNTEIDKESLSKKDAEKVLKMLESFDQVLGLLNFETTEEVPEDLKEALERRETARHEKNWAEADRLRDWIAHKGYVIEDTPKGATLKKRD